MFSEYSNQAILTLLYLLNENDSDQLMLQRESPDDLKLNTEKFEAPQIEDVFKIALEERMDIDTMKRVMYLLYEYQLERSYYEPDAVKHLTHFDHMFEILSTAHRRLIELELRKCPI